MQLQAIPAAPGTLALWMEYDPTGLAWCAMYDNPAIARLIDTSNLRIPAMPISVRPLALPPPKTDPVLSPQWAVRRVGTWFVPGVVRGSAAAPLFSSLATNNGARRQLCADFTDPVLIAEWLQWSASNPTLALSEPPH